PCQPGNFRQIPAMPTLQPPPLNSPPTSFSMRIIRGFETVVISLLIFLMMVVVGLSVLELGFMLWRQFTQADQDTQSLYLFLNLHDLLEVLRFFMMVLIGLELLETIKNYLAQHALHVEVVILVAMIAVARKVIILDMKEIAAESKIGRASCREGR